MAAVDRLYVQERLRAASPRYGHALADSGGGSAAQRPRTAPQRRRAPTEAALLHRHAAQLRLQAGNYRQLLQVEVKTWGEGLGRPPTVRTPAPPPARAQTAPPPRPAASARRSGRSAEHAKRGRPTRAATVEPAFNGDAARPQTAPE